MSNKILTRSHNHLAAMRRKGWTLRPAARLLGVHHAHLSRVLNGERHSRSLLTRVAALPDREEVAP